MGLIKNIQIKIQLDLYKDGNMNKITYQEFQKLEKAN